MALTKNSDLSFIRRIFFLIVLAVGLFFAYHYFKNYDFGRFILGCESDYGYCPPGYPLINKIGNIAVIAVFFCIATFSSSLVLLLAKNLIRDVILEFKSRK